jgi:membrane-bound lytic murein transglycosylase B
MDLPIRSINRLVVLFVAAVVLAGCVSVGTTTGLETGDFGEPPRSDGPIPPEFTAYVEDELRPAAERAGISRRVFDDAFEGLGPDPDVLARATSQPEFSKSLWEYLDSSASDRRIADGQAMLARYAGLLADLEARYGVPRTIIVAIWGKESTYGQVLGDPKVVKNAVRALATLSWKGGKRSGYGRTQLIAVLKILQSGDVDSRHITGSWAGAMGHTQFIPTTYLAYAVDYDGDGRRDIWTSVPDALASTANYLNRAGWRAGETWGYEVILPAGFDASRAGQRRSVAEWQAAGIVRATGQAFPRPGDGAQLWLPAGASGPAFLRLHNFNVIKRYNNADAYALGVGHLADRIGGGGPIVGQWPRLYQPLFAEADRMDLQRRLASLGYPVGEIDGKIGSGTTAAIRAYQADKGLEVNGWASQELLARLRAGG